jgi:hypothetical protein
MGMVPAAPDIIGRRSFVWAKKKNMRPYLKNN